MGRGTSREGEAPRETLGSQPRGNHPQGRDSRCSRLYLHVCVRGSPSRVYAGLCCIMGCRKCYRCRSCCLLSVTIPRGGKTRRDARQARMREARGGARKKGGRLLYKTKQACNRVVLWRRVSTVSATSPVACLRPRAALRACYSSGTAVSHVGSASYATRILP